ncbi:MAG: type IV secretion system DNA-binding domain-containing protein [Verrucomicrobiota bacterium]
MPFAILSLLVGTCLGLLLPAPFNLVVFVFSAACGGYCVLRSKTRRVILRYGRLTWTKEELARHFLISGDTGCGKTTSGFHSILFQLTQSLPSWGGLVLDAKGNESEFIRELMQHAGREQDLIEIKVRPELESSNWTPPHRFNLVSDRRIPWMTHAKFIIDVASSMTSGKQHAFFRSISQIALCNAFELIDARGLPVTLARAYQVLTSKDTTLAYIQPFTKADATPEQKKLARFFQTNFTEALAYEQREGIVATITTYLGFFMQPDVVNVFCSDEPNTFSIDEISRGTVITLSMPQTLATERRYIQTYLKMLFYIHSLRRLDKPKASRKEENMLLLVADEFQSLVTSSDDGISDYNVIDKVREANAALIAGMQSELSADPVINANKRKVLSLNLRSRLIFRAADLEGAQASADFVGKRTIWKRTRSSKPLGSVTTSRREEQEYYVTPEKLLRLGNHTAVIVHPSKRFLRKKMKPLDGTGKVYPWH